MNRDRLANVTAVLSALLVVSAALGSLLTAPHALGGSPSDLLPFVGVFLGFGGVGWLLARRVPGNAIGWLFQAGGVFWAAFGAATFWGQLALDGTVPLDRFAAFCLVLPSAGWPLPVVFSIQLPLLLLPDGRPLSRRWRPVVWLTVASAVAALVGFFTYSAPIEDLDPSVRLMNPFGVPALGQLPLQVALTGAALLGLILVAGGVGVLLRFRRSRRVERQQLRWVAFGGLITVFSVQSVGFLPEVIQKFTNLGLFAIPVCVGIAILRYRLYDLGRIVSRTLSYAIVTAVLLGLYVAGVTSAARLAPGSSSLAVAASTLAVAALFQPLRRRVQSGVNRRFNRARYDADRTVDAFTRRLRDEVDLDAVRADLLQVVHGTMQPASVGLWLRDGAR